jgi:hypothetical protein
MIAARIYERDTDAIFIRMLRQSRALSALLGGRCGLGGREVVDVRGQQRHAADSGSIDIVLRLSGGAVLLIENKIDAAYSITRAGHGQPQRYRRSVEAYRSAGAQAHSVLLAPESYLAASRLKVAFDAHLTYEEVCLLASGPDRSILEQAIAHAAAPYEPIPNEGAGEFFAALRKLIQSRYSDLVMKHDPNALGIRPDDSRTIYFDVPKTLRAHLGVPRPRMSLQCWDKAAPSASVKIMLGSGARLAGRLAVPPDLSDIGGYLRRAGQSLGIVIDTPVLDTQSPLAEQSDDVIEALNAALRLQAWWNANPEVLVAWVGEAAALDRV